MARGENFILNSDYPVDKIIYFYENEITPTTLDAIMIPHHLGTTPLVMGVYSLDNWETTQELAPLYPYFIGADDTNVIIMLNAYIGTPVKVRIFGFAKSNDFTSFPKTNQSAGALLFNTDYDYLELLTSGSAITDENGGAVVAHNLGYRPMVMTWGVAPMNDLYPNTISPIVDSSYVIGMPPPPDPITPHRKHGAVVTENDVKIYGQKPNMEVQYRIYVNEI